MKMELPDLKNILSSSPITAVSTFIVLALGILYLVLKSRPRGPRGWPYFGILPYLKNETVHITLQELTKKYGDVYCFTALGTLFVHLGNIKSFKEAYVTKADCFTNKSDNFSLLSLIFNDGILATNGERWKTIRKFFVQAFREFGLSSMKDYLTGPIYESVEGTVSKLRLMEGKAVSISSILTVQSSTIMKRTLFGESGITEEELKGIIENYEKLLSIFANIAALYQGPIARYILFPRMPNYKNSMEGKKNIEELLKKIIKRHENTLDEDGIRDVIDSYIKERNDRRKKNDPTAEYFTESCLTYSLVQIVGDGVSAIVIFINYILYVLLEYPEEQEKIFKEVQEVVGLNRGITLEDKSKMTYTNAFLLEALRTTDFFSLVGGLECNRETTIDSCKIPVGTITMVNLHAIHHDPRVYKDPDAFRPSRFISEAGKPKPELPVLFGVGKRTCAGESFTMMQVFLFVTTIIKNFSIEKPKNFSKKQFYEGDMEFIVHSRKQTS